MSRVGTPTKVRFGIDAMTQPEVSNHIRVILGIKQMTISFHRLSWYLAGSWYPAITSWTPITTLHMPYDKKVYLGMIDGHTLVFRGTYQRDRFLLSSDSMSPLRGIQ